jgi:hypothetical protein
LQVLATHRQALRAAGSTRRWSIAVCTERDSQSAGQLFKEHRIHKLLVKSLLFTGKGKMLDPFTRSKREQCALHFSNLQVCVSAVSQYEKSGALCASAKRAFCISCCRHYARRWIFSLGVHGKEDERDIFAACTLLILRRSNKKWRKTTAAHIIE